MIYTYRGRLYPSYLKTGNAMQFIAPAALHFCQGAGLDVGAGRWPLPGAIPVDLINGGDAMNLPEGEFDFIFSSHAIEHLANPVAAIEHWKTRLRPRPLARILGAAASRRASRRRSDRHRGGKGSTPCGDENSRSPRSDHGKMRRPISPQERDQHPRPRRGAGLGSVVGAALRPRA